MKKTSAPLLKFTLLIFVTTIFICRCSQNNSSEKTLTDTTVIEKPIITKTACDSMLPVDLINASSLKRWLSFYTNKYPAFQLNDFKFENCSEEGSLFSHTYEPSKEYLDLYKSLIVYSPDSSMFIDMDSYNFLLEKDKKGNLIGMGGDPETEVALIDLKTNTQKRLSYTGPGTIIEEVSWINQSTLVIAYLTDTDNENAFIPHVLVVDLNTNTFSYFKSKLKTDLKSARDYLYNVRWKSIKIKK